MNQADLISNMTQDGVLNKSQAETALKLIKETIVGQLQQAGSITISGLGTFSKKERSARDGRNPQTGEAMKIAAKTVVKFKAAKQLSDKVN